ncbi:hypothetical protein OG205_13965 [Lentzea sp. NBC_00516]|uniref:hypothetical protein n=1 Tax=Lentzea sp. NBC_00516 TaxID=2903582 RepID=UPI002E820EFB|nr:hypothetical protein [Lentzea sp. NBC_00516]WUD28055.1 hypothetical protein OG205_13965 [Lentzea sp. NBC_00516]
MTEPTPEEATAALHSVRRGKDQVISSAIGSRLLWIVSGLALFAFCVVIDLFPAVSGWLIWPFLLVCLALSLGLRTRTGGALFGRPVAVSNRSLSVGLRWRLLRVAPVLAIGIVGALLIAWLHVPHGGIYYGALAGLYIMFLGPRFQLWLLRRQDEVSGGRD